MGYKGRTVNLGLIPRKIGKVFSKYTMGFALSGKP